MNKHSKHVWVIPEDDANRKLADGFIMHHQVLDARIQVAPPAGGWSKVLKVFEDEYVGHLQNHPGAHVVMLVDFDERGDDRMQRCEAIIPGALKDRVFILGSRDNPETLKAILRNNLESIGRSLADECDRGVSERWGHEHLKHNNSELTRLMMLVKPFLFENS